MHLLFRTRHLLASIAIVLILGMGGFTVVGFASADDGTSSELPFTIAPFMHGDAGTLVLEPGEVDADDLYRGIDPNPVGQIDFTLGAQSTLYDQDGIERYVVPTTIRENDDGRIRESTLFMEGSFGRVIATESESSSSYTYDDGTTSDVNWYDVRYGQASNWLHCAFVAPFTVANIDSNRHNDDRSCEFGPYGLDAGQWEWEIAGLGLQDAIRVIELNLWYNSGAFDSEPDMQIWYREDIPVPIRMQDNSGYGGTNDGDAWVLAGFERGDTPIISGPTGNMLPSLANAAATEVVLDDSGLNHEFTLTQAVAQARLTSPELADFESTHPDAFMWCARSAVFDMDGRHTFRWTFWMTDGTDVHGTAIAKDTAPSTQVIPGVGGAPETTYRFEEAGGCPYADYDDEGNAQIPTAGVTSAPTVASSLEVADAILAELYNPNGSATWQFQVFSTGELFVSAGQVYYYREQEATNPLVSIITGEDNRRDVWDTAEAHWIDGELSGFSTVEQVNSRGEYVESGGDFAAVNGGDTQKATGAWAVPPTTAVAGIAIGAGALGVLYWLSPLLRVPLVGLFSRVRADQALEHPVRAKLVETITANPGIHFQDLVRHCEKGRGTVEHHLRILTDKGLVGVRVGPGYRCFFLPGQVDRRVMEVAHLLKAPAAREILVGLRKESRVTDLADKLGITKAAVSRHVKRLEEGGLVARRQSGREQWLRATELGIRAA